MRRAALALIALALSTGSALALSAHPPDKALNSATSNTRLEELRAFQEREQRVQTIGWRLIRGNAEICDTVIASIGLQLQDMAMFADPNAVRATLGLKGAFAVQSVAKGSPADRAGTFSHNREITALNAVDPNRWEAGERLHWQRLTRAHDWIDSQLAQEGAITIRFDDGSTSALKPVPVCATRFELQHDSKNAMAEGARVIIGSRFVGFDWEEDEILAGVIAHELAHNLLHHRAWLDRNGRKRRHVRLTEREADRLIPWLLANAGYDPAAAYRFMMRWGKKHDAGLFRARTHDGWDERAEFIEAELPLIAALMGSERKADWSTHFQREMDPNQGRDSAQRP